MDSVYTLKKPDIKQAGLVLAEAFQDDPVFSAIFSGAPDEQRVAFFTTPVVYCLKHGRVVAPSEQIEGVAAWVRKHYADMNLWHMLSSSALWVGMQIGMKIAQKMKVVFDPVEQDRREHMRGRDYIYLQIIGVASQYQGQGFGRLLLDDLFSESEQAGLPIYLETETEANVSLYQHLGFSVLSKRTLPLIDLPMWAMVREPGG